MNITKINNEEFGGIIPDSDNYEDEINHIGISRERARQPNEPLTEDEHAALRSELWKLMRIARLARQAAIYDAPAAAQTFSDGELFDILERSGGIFEDGGKGSAPKGKEEWLRAHARFFLNLRANDKRMLIR